MLPWTSTLASMEEDFRIRAPLLHHRIYSFDFRNHNGIIRILRWHDTDTPCMNEHNKDTKRENVQKRNTFHQIAQPLYPYSSLVIKVQPLLLIIIRIFSFYTTNQLKSSFKIYKIILNKKSRRRRRRRKSETHTQIQIKMLNPRDNPIPTPQLNEWLFNPQGTIQREF